MEIYSKVQNEEDYPEYTKEDLGDLIYPCYAVVNENIKLGFSKTGIVNDVIIDAATPYSLANIKQKDEKIEIDVDIKSLDEFRGPHSNDWHLQMLDISDVISYCLFRYYGAKKIILDKFLKKSHIFKKRALKRFIQKDYMKNHTKVTLDMVYTNRKIISDVKIIKTLALKCIIQEIRDSIFYYLEDFI